MKLARTCNQREDLSRFAVGHGGCETFLRMRGRVAFNRCSGTDSCGFFGLLILGMMVLSGCETVIEIDPPDYNSEITITSNFTPDSLWSATVTKTLPIGSLRNRSEVFLTNASVMVYQGDSVIDRLIYDPEQPGSGRYISSRGLRPESSIPYRMVVEAPGLRSISAVSIAPLFPEITSIEIAQLSPPDIFGDSEHQISFSLASRPGLNYYSFTIFYGFLEESVAGTTEYTIQYVYMRYDSPKWYCSFTDLLNPVAVAVGEQFSCAIGVLSDRFVNESSLDFEIKFDLDEEFLNYDNINLILAVLALSPEYVEYQGSVEEQDDYDGFGQPVNLYSNVDGGRGIFAGYSAAYRLFDPQSVE